MGDTVSSLKQYISKFFGLEWSDNMRCVLEQRTSETLDLLDDDSKQLRSISFGISTKVSLSSLVLAEFYYCGGGVVCSTSSGLARKVCG